MPCYRLKTEPMTLWEAKDDAGIEHGYLRKRPKPGQGHPEHPDLWPEEVDREKSKVLPGFDDGFICGELGPHCTDPTCGAPGDFLCDYPMSRGKTCDLPMCEDHAHDIGTDRHLCEIHFREWQRNAGIDRINQWPPRKRL